MMLELGLQGRCYTYFETIANLDRLFLIRRSVHDAVDNPSTTYVAIRNATVTMFIVLFPHDGLSVLR